MKYYEPGGARTHPDLNDMPDTAGTVTDHDIRLVAKVQGTIPTTPAPFKGMIWLDTASTGASPTPGVFSIIEITTDLTLTVAHTVIFADATSGDVTVTLPVLSGNTGKYYRVKKLDASVNKVIVDGNGAETVDGAATAEITTRYDALDFIASTVEWGIF